MSPKLKSKTRCIGILTSGGDCPGLNAAIRGVAKPALGMYGMKVVGIMDGFRGLVENRTVVLDDRAVSGILTQGGTLLGTSRDKPNKMPMGGKVRDMTDVAVENAKRLQIDCLVCLGGGGTQKNALRLREHGLNVVTLPKTIDNDVAETDITFGFDTAMQIATDAIDRLHTTATSHHRIIVCEVMGHRAGWLPLGAGLAGGADVILIPEIPYNTKVVVEHLRERRRTGKRFSIVAVAEGAISKEEAAALENAKPKKGKNKKDGNDASDAPTANGIHLVEESKASRLARELQQLADIEARVTSLGHVQRGGTPSATDRLLCTNLGTAAAALIAQGRYNVMVAVKGGVCVPVPLEQVAGKRKEVPVDHEWIRSARFVGTCMGDK
jgi:ATP-dependent phosphofructokinase / diphosphate-dependent phosphofructokinase